MLLRAVQEAMDEAKISRAEMAVLLGTSRSNVSQLLDGSRNMTAKTLAGLLWACGRQVRGLHTEEIGHD